MIQESTVALVIANKVTDRKHYTEKCMKCTPLDYLWIPENLLNMILLFG